jgi:methanogenic corrinoid protein MtbC1
MQQFDSVLRSEVRFSVTAPPARSATRQRREALVRTIEDQIVPRLLVACTPPDLCQPAGAVAPPAPDVLHLVALALAANDSAARHHIVVQAAHLTLETLCLHLLQPAARALGEMWMEDTVSFTDVTIAMMRLHDGLNAVTSRARDALPEARRRHRILLAAAPGDNHRFGLAIVGAFFEQAGWSVTTAHQESVADLCDMLRHDWFGVLGFSVSAEAYVPPLAAALPRLRRASRNASLAVLVGGAVFTARPDLARDIGADATAANGVQATWVAENMLGARPPDR